MPTALRAFPLLLGAGLTLTGRLSAQQSDDSQQKTLNALRNFAVHARVQLSDPAALPPIDEALLRDRLEDSIRRAGLKVQRSNDVRNGTQAEVGLQYLVVSMPDSWGRPSSFAASSCIEASQLVRLQRITPTGAPVYAVVPTWRSCGVLVGDKASFSGTILRNADQQISRFISAWRRANAPRRSEPPPARTFGRLQKDNRVELLDLRTGIWKLIYQPTTWGISDLSVAPSGDRLAILSWTKGVVTGVDYSVQPRAELVVIDTSGRSLARVPDVHKYDWCGSDRVAYIQGEYSEDSDWGFRPDGRWGLLEIATGTTTPIKGPRNPTAVTWNPLDSAVYLRDASESPAIYRFDLRTGILEPSPVHDIQFSPDGRYYLYRPLELGNDSVQVYETRSNTLVDISGLLRSADLVGWAGPAGDVLLAVRHVPRPPRKPGERSRVRVIQPSDIKPLSYFLYRVSDGRVLAEEQGFLHGLAGSADRRLIRQGEKYQVLEPPGFSQIIK